MAPRCPGCGKRPGNAVQGAHLRCRNPCCAAGLAGQSTHKRRTGQLPRCPDDPCSSPTRNQDRQRPNHAGCVVQGHLLPPGGPHRSGERQTLPAPAQEAVAAATAAPCSAWGPKPRTPCLVWCHGGPRSPARTAQRTVAVALGAWQRPQQIWAAVTALAAALTQCRVSAGCVQHRLRCPQLAWLAACSPA